MNDLEESILAMRAATLLRVAQKEQISTNYVAVLKLTKKLSDAEVMERLHKKAQRRFFWSSWILRFVLNRDS